jgi:hypothetical protein
MSRVQEPKDEPVVPSLFGTILTAIVDEVEIRPRMFSRKGFYSMKVCVLN